MTHERAESGKQKAETGNATSAPRSFPLSAFDVSALPSRVRLLKWGVNPTTEGDVIVNERTLAGFAAWQHKVGREEAALDFEHNTVEGTPEYVRSQEPRPVAAFGQPVVIAGDGLYLENLSWTETGTANHQHYTDLSAAPWLDADRVVVGLHSGALCRAGAAYGIKKLSAGIEYQDGLTLVCFSVGPLPCRGRREEAAPAAPTPPNVGAYSGAPAGPSSILHPPSSPSPQPLSALVGAGAVNQKLKMSDSLTPEVLSAQIAAALKPFADRLAAIEAQPKPDLAAFTARLDKMDEHALNEQRARIVPLFASEGKVPQNPATGKAYTADELAALDLPTLRVLHANTPPTVPLSARAGSPREASSNGGSFAQLVALKAKEAGSKEKGLHLAIAADPEGHKQWLQSGAGKL